MRRLPLSTIEPGTRTLPPHAAHYMIKVLRVRPGDPIEVFDPQTGTTASARVLSVGTEVLISIESLHTEPAITPLILVQGYPKGDKLGDIIRDATELGATLIVPAICERSIARPDAAKGDARAERFTTIANEAARQCGRARAPEIAPPMSFAEALEVARGESSHRFVLWERATVRLGPDLTALEGTAAVAFAIGPEGGLTEGEIAIAEKHGFAPRSLGTTILRTETAATAVLGAYRVLSA